MSHISHRSARRSFVTSGLIALAAMLSLSTQATADEPGVPDRTREARDSRPFHMGFTPFHFSWVEDRISETYDMIYGHADMIAYHFDEGVPWPEAFAGEPYHDNVEKELAHRKEQLRDDKKLYVATTPINFERKGMADYWGEKNQDKRPKGWRDRKLDDPEVIKAYTNYCLRLIEQFDPDYFVYGVEVNLLAMNDPEEYQRFITLASRVYPELKKRHPQLSISLSFYLHSPERLEMTREHVQPLLAYTDLFAVSSYPYMGYEADGYAAEDIPANWWSQSRELAPGKPFAIAENGYIAEDLKVFSKTMPGSESAQRLYMENMLRDAAELDAQFVVWFVVADYDELWGVLKWMVLFNPLIRAWKDTGVFDGDLQPRPALEVWDQWLAKPVRR